MTWTSLPIAAIARPRLGGNYPNRSTPTRRPLIKMGNIARVDIDLTRVEYIPDSASVDEIHRLKYGDVLFNTRNTLDLVGKVSIWRDELPVAYYNSNILRLEFRTEVCGDTRYFGYALNSHSAVERIRTLATGTTSVAAVYTRDLLKLELPVPDKQEQRAIAELLNDADQLVVRLERLLAKKRAIKQGMMQELLTGRTRLPGFDGGWVQDSAGEIGVFKGGSGFAVRYQGEQSEQYPFFKVSDMNNTGNDTFMRVANNYVSETVRKRVGAAAFPTGAIVFAKVGAAVFLERKRVLTRPSCIDNNMAAFVVDRKVADPRFIHYVLTNFRLSSLVAVGALPSLNAKQLRAIPISHPTDIAEQGAIADVLANADAEIEALERRLEATRAIKQGMMQELLTGRTRLVGEGAA